MVALLRNGLPEEATAALDLVERQLLVGVPSTGEPNEDRNYRLPLALRRELDRLAGELGSRVTRSMLIAGILGDAMPAGVQEALALIREQLVASIRAAVAAA